MAVVFAPHETSQSGTADSSPACNQIRIWKPVQKQNVARTWLVAHCLPSFMTLFMIDGQHMGHANQDLDVK